jgi:TonB family protein
MIRASTLVVLAIVLSTMAQDSGKLPKGYDVKRCTPKVIKHAPRPKHLAIRPQKGEKSTGYPPLISFQILESGEVSNAQVKRSSGFAGVDKHALEWIRGTKYNSRSGCGVVDSEASVLIHWVGGN